MNINTHKPRIQNNLQPRKQEQADPGESDMDAYYKDSVARQSGETFRAGATIGAGVAALGTAGYYLGNMTGIGGRVVGAVVGLAAGVTAGGVAGSIAGSGKGSGALAHLGIGVLGGAIVGTVAGAIVGADALPIAGAISGGVGGVAVGFLGHQMLEDSADKRLRAKHGIG